LKISTLFITHDNQSGRQFLWSVASCGVFFIFWEGWRGRGSGL